MFEKNNQDNRNQNEEIPVIIHQKKQDYADFGGRYSPEDGYYKLALDEERQTYRWNLEDEERRRRTGKEKKARKNLGLKIFAAAMSVMFVFSALFSIALLIENSFGSANTSLGSNLEPLTIRVPPVDNNAEELTVSGVIEKVRPSVVSIESEVEMRSGFWGRGGSFSQRGTGSGFILTEDGYIATNYHVITNATSITVLLDNGRSYPATVVGGDEIADIAIIKINARNLIPAELGNSDGTKAGEFVVAIGSPGGLAFAGSSTFGIISGVNRDLEVSRGRRMTLLQTDAAINPGNSGGPLVNMRGQVIGINTLKLASSILSPFMSSISYEGMGFAIPISLAVERFNEIIANPNEGEIIREPEVREYSEADVSEVSFGISGRSVDPSEAEHFDVPLGFIVMGVVPGGASGRAGIEVQDIIIALDGETVESFEELVALKVNYQPGDEAVVTVYRDGEILDLTIEFDAR